MAGVKKTQKLEGMSSNNTPDDENQSPVLYKTRHTVTKDFAHDVSYVMFDLETGGLDYRTSDILQISAVCGTDTFNIYVSPERSSIDQGASKVNKLTIVQGTLHYKGDAVNSINIKEALENFIDFLENVHKPVLVGHNIKKFDVPFIGFYLKRYSLWERFLAAVVGFVDTWILFKQVYPFRPSYKQVDLVEHFLHESYDAHNALEDVKALQKLSDLVKDKLWDYRFGAK